MTVPKPNPMTEHEPECKAKVKAVTLSQIQNPQSRTLKHKPKPQLYALSANL